MASLHFYRCFLDVNGEPTHYMVSKLINHIGNIMEKDPGKSTIKMGHHWYTMSECCSLHNDKTEKFFWIDKRDKRGSYTGTLGTRERSPFTKPLYNPASCLLLSTQHLLIVYQPQGCPSYVEIAKFLTDYIDNVKESDYQYDIVLTPISRFVGLTDINSSYIIKKLYLKLDPIKFTGELKSKSNHKSLKESLLDLIFVSSSITSNMNESDKDKPFITLLFKGRRNDKNNTLYSILKVIRNVISVKNINKRSGIREIGAIVQGPNGGKPYRLRIINSLKKSSNLLIPFDINDTGWESIRDDMLKFWDTPSSIPSNDQEALMYNYKHFAFSKINISFDLNNNPDNSFNMLEKDKNDK